MSDISVLLESGPDVLHVIPFGGCGEFGMNLTVYIHNGHVVVVDCGVMFPDPTKLGVDAIYPQIDPWFEQLGGVTAYLITHAHEDHVGALAHVAQRWPAPIYATAWTTEVIHHKLSNLGIADQHSVTTIKPGDRTICGSIDAEWIHLNHSIPMACGLFLRTEAGNVFHTGDFKIDLSSRNEAPADIKRLEQLGREGVDLLLADSTNSMTKGFCPGEEEVVPALESMIGTAPGNVFVTTFASNYWRLKTVFDVCERIGRRVVIAGRGMNNTLQHARNSGLVTQECTALIDEDQAASVERGKLVVVATGSQGENTAALARIVHGEHKRLGLTPGDSIIFSSRIVPGNERPILDLMNHCMRAGAKVTTWRQNPLVHVSGHAYAGELALMIEKLRPKHFIPVHGTHHHLLEHLQIARDYGISNERSMLAENGQIVSFSRQDGLSAFGVIDIERAYIDGFSRAVMPHETMRERLRVGELGGALVYAAINLDRETWAVPPEVELIGLAIPYNVDSGPWLDLAAEEVADRVMLAVQQGQVTHEELSEVARVTLRRYLNASLGKKPVVFAKVLIL